MIVKDYIEGKKQGYIKEGKHLFLGTPDEWYEPYTVCCINGHVSNRTLKTDKGNVCLACGGELYLCPPETTEEELQIILKQNV